MVHEIGPTDQVGLGFMSKEMIFGSSVYMLASEHEVILILRRAVLDDLLRDELRR